MENREEFNEGMQEETQNEGIENLDTEETVYEGDLETENLDEEVYDEEFEEDGEETERKGVAALLQGKNILWIVLTVVFLIGAIVCVTFMVRDGMRRKAAEEEFSRVAELTEQESSASSVEEEPIASVEPTPSEEPSELDKLVQAGVPVPEDKDVDIKTLQDTVNKDIYAWIYIPDTKVDYPILQDPDDNTHYLNYNLDGSKGYPGCIYTENYNSEDFTDPNTVLYGHNMKNGTMFAGLHKFKDSDYFNEHPYIYVYTEDGLLVYEIFAAYEHGDEHLLLSRDLDSDTVFADYLNEVLNTRNMNSNIRSDVELSEKDRIITLSTCIANKHDRRYLVQGVLLNETNEE